jgi:hypothetical protein
VGDDVGSVGSGIIGVLFIIWGLLFLIFNRFFARLQLAIQRQMTGVGECDEREMESRLRFAGWMSLAMGVAAIAYSIAT